MTKLEEFCEANKAGSCSWFESDARIDEAKWWVSAFVKLVRDRANQLGSGFNGYVSEQCLEIAFNEIVKELGLEYPASYSTNRKEQNEAK